VRVAIEEDDIRKEVLENAIDTIVSNKALDRVVGSALHSIHPPHYEKLASALPSLHMHLHLHLLLHLPGVWVWAVIPGVALLVAAGVLPHHTTDASATSSIVPLHRVAVTNSTVPLHRLRQTGKEASGGKARLSRGERIKAARAARKGLDAEAEE
jgi:hypothetical protein